MHIVVEQEEWTRENTSQICQGEIRGLFAGHGLLTVDIVIFSCEVVDKMCKHELSNSSHSQPILAEFQMTEVGFTWAVINP